MSFILHKIEKSTVFSQIGFPLGFPLGFLLLGILLLISSPIHAGGIDSAEESKISGESKISMSSPRNLQYSSDWEEAKSKSSKTWHCPIDFYGEKQNWFIRTYHDIKRDHQTYYSLDNLPNLGGLLLTCAVMANTKIDHGIHRFWQTGIRSRTTDKVLAFPGEVGSFSQWRIYAAALVLGLWQNDTYLGNVIYQWGYRALRTMVLISPQELFFSWAIGNGRPKEHQSSKWRFFLRGGEAGCSGHAFNGAIPFITAAMMTEEPTLRYTLFALSTLPAISRVNKDAHFFSQCLLGWGLAFLTANAVDDSDWERDKNMRFIVFPRDGGGMIYTFFRF